MCRLRHRRGQGRRQAPDSDTFIEPDDPLDRVVAAPIAADRDRSGPFTLTAGDFVVTDAQPFPTSKAQCKNGGWRNFPGFKNQGQCVSFVATGGKKQP